MHDVENDLAAEQHLVALLAMWLPLGFCCGDCEHFMDCAETVDTHPEQTVCDETPSRFRLARRRQKKR